MLRAWFSLKVRKGLCAEVVLGQELDTGKMQGRWPGPDRRSCAGLSRRELAVTRDTDKISSREHRTCHRCDHRRGCGAGDAGPRREGLGMRILFQGKPLAS